MWSSKSFGLEFTGKILEVLVLACLSFEATHKLSAELRTHAIITAQTAWIHFYHLFSFHSFAFLCFFLMRWTSSRRLKSHFFIFVAHFSRGSLDLQNKIRGHNENRFCSSQNDLTGEKNAKTKTIACRRLCDPWNEINSIHELCVCVRAHEGVWLVDDRFFIFSEDFDNSPLAVAFIILFHFCSAIDFFILWLRKYLRSEQRSISTIVTRTKSTSNLHFMSSLSESMASILGLKTRKETAKTTIETEINNREIDWTSEKTNSTWS